MIKKQMKMSEALSQSGPRYFKIISLDFLKCRYSWHVLHFKPLLLHDYKQQVPGTKVIYVTPYWKSVSIQRLKCLAVSISITDPPNNQQVLPSGDIKGKITKDRVMLASVSWKKSTISQWFTCLRPLNLQICSTDEHWSQGCWILQLNLCIRKARARQATPISGRRSDDPQVCSLSVLSEWQVTYSFSAELHLSRRN